MSFSFEKEQAVIIITSDEAWSEVWHTQLHYAWNLSLRCMVYYVGPPEKWKFANLFFWRVPVRKENNNLFIVTYHTVFPVKLLNGFFVRFNDAINSFLLKKKIPKNKTNILLWRFTYFRFIVHPFIHPSRSVYHVVDQYMGKKNDRFLAEKSDLVISTSPKFMDHYKKYNPHVINIPQAVSKEEFVCDESVVNKIKNEYGKIILFIGTLSPDISFDIFEKVSENFTRHNILMIGPEKFSDHSERNQFENILNKANVKYIGVKPAAQLKNYVKASEVCIIPYKSGSEKKMSIRSPLKAINYIAQKKIVVSTIDCEIKELENKIIYNAGNHEEFIFLIQKAIDKELIVDEKAVNEFLGKISYDKLIDFIFSRL
ncbi:MAG TPA: hypothetical protein VJY62_12305 [Bacteroidia bacterium]|nr:hypothetical protein [Bacteroidia bacterium]